MKKNFTKLLSVLAGIILINVPTKGEEKMQMRTVEASICSYDAGSQNVELRSEEITSKRDSIILYDAIGNKISKLDDDWICYKWQDNLWVPSNENLCNTMFYTYNSGEISYDIEDGIIRLYYPMSSYSPYFLIFSYLTLSSKPEITYNANKQITKIIVPGDAWNADRVIDITYNIQGKLLTINHYKGELYRRLTYNYLPDGIKCNRFEYSELLNGNWSLEYNSETVFGNNGQLFSVTGWKSESNWFRYEFKYNDEREISRYDYIGTDNKWGLFQYVIRYYNDIPAISNVEVVNNNPIESDNKGSFNLDVNIPTDSIGYGSITITFPKDFTLDEKNTTLTLDFSSFFTFTITKQENNSWLLEIKQQSLRRALLRTDEAKKMFQVAYMVDENVKRGTYDIFVNNIFFETKGGNYIHEPAITVPAAVERLSVGNELINKFAPVVYTSNQTIYIQASQEERIKLYSIMGHKLYESEIQSGLNVINAVNFPQGILIIKGNSGWTKKLIIEKR